MKTINVIGIGPGEADMMTYEAMKVLEGCDTIIGYTVYIELLKERFSDKKLIATPMRSEVDRCRKCFEETYYGKDVALVCSGDAGVYGMASLMYELLPQYEGVELRIVPGITAALSGAAILGAPLNHDFCVISLSDLLTPWEMIEKRIKAAVIGDFAMAIYNPSSMKRKDYLYRACNIMLEAGAHEERAAGYVRNIGRENTLSKVCSLKELMNEEVDMFTTVFIGNSQTFIAGDKLVTKRGYIIKND